MENLKRPSKWIWVGVISLAASLLGFLLSFQDEQARFSEMGSITQSHLNYALQLKDDMAVIDWSKALEKVPSILAFRVNCDSKIVAEGGNKAFCPISAPDGLSFDFPYRWTMNSNLKINSAPAELILVFQDFRGPFFWAFCFFILPFSVGWLLIAVGALDKNSSTPAVAAIKAGKIKPVLKPVLSNVDEKTLTLTLDKDYIICQATPLVAKAFGREVSELIGNHFLDLLPDPLVMKAIGEGQEIKLLKPFPSYPRLSALLRPTTEGTVLIFESEPSPEGA